MIRKRLVSRPNWPDGTGYDPRLVLVVEGTDDIYRLARLLERGQSEFADLGVRILRSMDRQRPGVVRKLTAHMGPVGIGYAGSRRTRRGEQLPLEFGVVRLSDAGEVVPA